MELSQCASCINIPGGTKDLLLKINGTPRTLQNDLLGVSYGGCSMGYYDYPQKGYKPKTGLTTPVYFIPKEGGTVNFDLKSICQYPLFEGFYPPDGPVLGHLVTQGAYESVNTGYNITIKFPPQSGSSSIISCYWCGVFFSGESQLTSDCQKLDSDFKNTCEFTARFRIEYANCPSCKTQTVGLPSTNLTAIIDHNNVYWSLGEGVIIDCNTGSKKTKDALDKIKAKLIEIDTYYGACSYGATPTVTAQNWGLKYCTIVSAKNFHNQFRAISYGLGDTTYFNHDNC